MMLLWAIAGVPLGAYNISSNFNIALQIQPQILAVLSLITWGQCFHYDDVSFSAWSRVASLEPAREDQVRIDKNRANIKAEMGDSEV